VAVDLGVEVVHQGRQDGLQEVGQRLHPAGVLGRPADVALEFLVAVKQPIGVHDRLFWVLLTRA